MSFHLASTGGLIQSNQILMVGSEFSNCIWREVNDGWGNVKVFFKGEAKYIFTNLFLQFFCEIKNK